MGGRLLRPDDDKRFAYLLDHANWTRNHGFLTDPTNYSLTKAEKRPRKNSHREAPLKECPKCDSIHPLGTTVCIECGYEWPTRELQFTDENLVHLEPTHSSTLPAHHVPIEERQTAFDDLATQCQERGHKPNWARVRYMHLYGEWPCQQNGIAVPRFFWQYQRRYNNKLKQQDAERTAKAAP